MESNNIKIDNFDPFLFYKEDYEKTDEIPKNSFGSYLKEALDKVNELQIDAENYKKLLSTGEIDNLHDVTIAAEKANIGLQFILGMRNKIVEAYREIMRMQI